MLPCFQALRLLPFRMSSICPGKGSICWATVWEHMWLESLAASWTIKSAGSQVRRRSGPLEEERTCRPASDKQHWYHHDVDAEGHVGSPLISRLVKFNLVMFHKRRHMLSVSRLEDVPNTLKKETLIDPMVGISARRSHKASVLAGTLNLLQGGFKQRAKNGCFLESPRKHSCCSLCLFTSWWQPKHQILLFYGLMLCNGSDPFSIKAAVL